MDEKPKLELGGDRPKDSLADDRLGHAAFARALARSIAAMVPRDGIVLAINGPWGSGKTSAANMVVDALSEIESPLPPEQRVSVVRFNPWWFSGQEDLVRAFFDEVSDTLEKTFSKKVVDGLKSVGRRVSGARDLLIAGAELLPGGAMFKGVAAGAVSLVGKLSEDGGSLSSERAKLCDALREQGRRILVVIDDVDRLPADEALQIFRLVKSVADLPNVIHLLLFDRNAARRAVGQPPEDGGPEWLEKIVQASFDLPPVLPTDINRLFLEGLTAIAHGVELPDPIRWQNTFHDAVAPWLRTPRDVGRLLNAMTVAWPAVEPEVDFADFVGLEALRVFQPTLHAYVREHPAELTGVASNVRREDPELGDTLLALVPKSRRKDARAALQRLFPRLESTWLNHGYGSSVLAKWDKERRACSPTRFWSYFTLSVGPDALPRAEFNAFVSAIADPAAVRRTVAALAASHRAAGGTKAAVLLDELSTRSEEVPLSAIPDGVIYLLDVYDLFDNAVDERDKEFLGAPQMWKLWWAVKPLLLRLDAGRRQATLSRAFKTCGSLYVLGGVHDALKSQHEVGRGSANEAEERGLVPATVVAELGATLLTRTRDAARDDSLIGQAELMHVLTTWSGLAGPEEVKEWTADQLPDDKRVLVLAKAATYMARVHVQGDRVSSEVPQVSLEALGKLVDVDRLTARLAEIVKSGDEVAVTIASRFTAGADRPS